MAVVKSPKNNKKKNLWIIKNSSNLQKKTKSPIKITSKFKQSVKSYKLLNNPRKLTDSITFSLAHIIYDELD